VVKKPAQPFHYSHSQLFFALRKKHISGEALYSVTCRRCHAAGGSGGDIGPDIQGKTKDNIDQATEDVTAMKYQVDLVSLTFGERQAIADYLSEVE
jgi:mono/diheme cytochrome c family protein